MHDRKRVQFLERAPNSSIQETCYQYITHSVFLLFSNKHSSGPTKDYIQVRCTNLIISPRHLLGVLRAVGFVILQHASQQHSHSIVAEEVNRLFSAINVFKFMLGLLNSRCCSLESEVDLNFDSSNPTYHFHFPAPQCSSRLHPAYPHYQHASPWFYLFEGNSKMSYRRCLGLKLILATGLR
jgi:hypothetical protein